tara:strand:- start:430 stop:771 length:342 start_codon:yes stop_codon:yes gene_type:complete
MGAFESQDIAVGRFKDAQQAYDELVKEAQHEYGHSGYNGTISTSNGFFIRKKHPRFGTKAFDKFVSDTIDGTKFSRWNCIELHRTTLKKLKEEHGLKGKKNIKAFFFWGLAAS